MTRRSLWALLAVAGTAVSVWLCVNWWSAIWPNLAASVIWGTPALYMHAAFIRRHLDAQDQALARLHSNPQESEP